MFDYQSHFISLHSIAGMHSIHFIWWKIPRWLIRYHYYTKSSVKVKLANSPQTLYVLRTLILLTCLDVSWRNTCDIFHKLTWPTLPMGHARAVLVSVTGAIRYLGGLPRAYP